MNVPDKEDCIFILNCFIENREDAIKKCGKLPYYSRNIVENLKNEIFNLNLIKDYIQNN